MHFLLIVVNVLYIIYDFTFIYLFSVFLFLFLGEISYTATLVKIRGEIKKMRETPQVLTGSLLTQRQEAAETSNSSVM